MKLPLLRRVKQPSGKIKRDQSDEKAFDVAIQATTASEICSLERKPIGITINHSGGVSMDWSMAHAASQTRDACEASHLMTSSISLSAILTCWMAMSTLEWVPQ